jgi:hypothetical protein
MGAWAGSGDQDFSLPELAGIRPTDTASSIRTAAIPFRPVPPSGGQTLAQLGRGPRESLFKPAGEVDQSE